MKRLRPSHSTSMPELRLPKGWQTYAMLPATQGTSHGSALCSAAKDGSRASVSLTEPRSLYVVQRQWPRLLVQLSDDDSGVRQREVEVQQHEVTGYACQHLHTAKRCITLSAMGIGYFVTRYYGAGGEFYVGGYGIPTTLCHDSSKN